MVKTNVDILRIEFKIESPNKLDQETIELLDDIPLLQFYWSDKLRGYYSMDYKLPNGLWLENIFYNNEITKATAKIMN